MSGCNATAIVLFSIIVEAYVVYLCVASVGHETLRMFSVRVPGPLEEKDATTGAGLNPLTSLAPSIVALGFLCCTSNTSLLASV